MGREEECGAVEFGKGVGGFDDVVAEARQDGAVEGVEDGVLEDCVLDAVVLACVDAGLAGCGILRILGALVT